MPGMTSSNYTKTTGQWRGDFSDRRSHIPGGIPLDKTSLLTTFTDGLIPSGTLVGRTDAERNAGSPFGLFTAGDTEAYLTLDDANVNADVNVAAYRPGNIVYTMHLPTASQSGAAATFIASKYIVNKGRE
ncbi:hypothetical protein GCM10017784_34810 [Deinococcus indicus]|uniref:hypothetical protein n=1 Tax=Deinococcus indicus TaxID=223556 RepID=UPI00174DC0E5|nr:hypothetical protein [Deinococcus indicus]GHG37479.1 hypothetical protein GCM10017784_34810 [Deinococcus indicus]